MKNTIADKIFVMVREYRDWPVHMHLQTPDGHKVLLTFTRHEIPEMVNISIESSDRSITVIEDVKYFDYIEELVQQFESIFRLIPLKYIYHAIRENAINNGGQVFRN